LHRIRSLPIALAYATGLILVLTLPRHDTAATDYPPTSESCVECHDDALKSLTGTVHAIDLDAEKPSVWCTSCHPGDPELHIDDAETNPMAHPARLDPRAEAAICATCHASSHQQNMMEWNAHAENAVSCSSCHLVHGNDNLRLLVRQEPELCMECHPSVEGEFSRSYRHPVLDGVIECSECHMPLAERTRTPGFRGVGEVCFQCHPQFRGPFPFEHQAVVSYSTEEGGCLNCHEPHGSDQPRMLKQSYEAPHFTTCSQCHLVPTHQFNVQHGSQWAGVACNQCHVDIHGSYANRYLLSPDLSLQGCTSWGCHQF